MMKLVLVGLAAAAVFAAVAEEKLPAAPALTGIAVKTDWVDKDNLEGWEVSLKEPFVLQIGYATRTNVSNTARKDGVFLEGEGGVCIDTMFSGRSHHVYFYHLKSAQTNFHYIAWDPSLRTFSWWLGNGYVDKRTYSILPEKLKVAVRTNPNGEEGRVVSAACYRQGYKSKWRDDDPRPAAAKILGLGKLLFDEVPRVKDISPNRKGKYKWFNAIWYARERNMDCYRDLPGGDGIVLIAKATGEWGELVTCPPRYQDAKDAQVPALSGAKPFYVEFEVSLSDNNLDHFSAIWLMPVEKEFGAKLHMEGDPKGEKWELERWMELDVDEANSDPRIGVTGTVHNWVGAGLPRPWHIQNDNCRHLGAIDRTKRHRYGASYDPYTLTVKWYVDDVEIISASYPQVSTVAREQNFFLIMGAQQLRGKVPYEMYVHRVRAYTR